MRSCAHAEIVSMFFMDKKPEDLFDPSSTGFKDLVRYALEMAFNDFNFRTLTKTEAFTEAFKKEYSAWEESVKVIRKQRKKQDTEKLPPEPRMTEYLINWNENSGTTRNFDYAKDVFNFFRSINTCMLGDFNAWIHYAAKRYYGMLGDGQYGTSSGTVTKRGYVMAHFARFVTGMTRVEGEISDAAFTPLEGSVYISQSGDTVVAVLINPSSE